MDWRLLFFFYLMHTRVLTPSALGQLGGVDVRVRLVDIDKGCLVSRSHGFAQTSLNICISLHITSHLHLFASVVGTSKLPERNATPGTPCPLHQILGTQTNGQQRRHVALHHTAGHWSGHLAGLWIDLVHSSTRKKVFGGYLCNIHVA